MKKLINLLILLLISYITIGQNIRHDQLKEPNKETSDTVLFFISEVNGYWRIGKGVFNNITSSELTDSLNEIRENFQRNLDTIIWDATKYDLDFLLSFKYDQPSIKKVFTNYEIMKQLLILSFSLVGQKSCIL